MKKTIITITVLAIAAFVGFLAVRFLAGGRENGWFCTEHGWEKHGHPLSERPEQECPMVDQPDSEAAELDRQENRGELIGGQKDEHGCLAGAGYSWCPSTEKCQRMWEEYCEEFKDQFRITDFNTCVKAGNPIQESHPRKCQASDGQIYVEVEEVDNPIGDEANK